MAGVPGKINFWRLLIKGVALFFIFEFVLHRLVSDPASLNLRSVTWIQRDRFPISTNPPFDAPLDIGNLDVMFSSHIVTRPKDPGELRVLVLGDSAVWGIDLTSAQTLTAQLNDLNLRCAGKNIKIYNLSFPESSASKDLMILDKAMPYQPDLVIWLVTWNTLKPKARKTAWLLDQNLDEFYKLGKRFKFLPRSDSSPTVLDRLLVQNRDIFRTLRFELYSTSVLSGGQEQYQVTVPNVYEGLSQDVSFEGIDPPTLPADQVSIDQVKDFYQLAGTTRVLVVNQPMLILTDVPNSDLNYNGYYPRWIYDQYRNILQQAAEQNGWNYLDLWNLLSANYFSSSPLHLTPEGEYMLAKALAPAIVQTCR